MAEYEAEKFDEEFVICDECGHEQADMGHGVACEICDALMPTNQ